MRFIAIVSASLALGGCTLGNFASIHRSVDMTNGATQIIDAEQRMVIAYPPVVTDHFTGQGKDTRKSRTERRRILCAEPSPDTFSVIAASGEFRVDTAKVGVGGSGALSETGASLIDRTTALQALRDNYFRLCEAYANGMIDETDLMVGQRHNQTSLVGLIAIEQLTTPGRLPPVTIGGDASATSANAIGAISRQLDAALDRKIAADGAVTAAEAKLKADNDELKVIKALSGDAATAKADRKAELETSIKAQEEQLKGLKAKQTSASAAVDALSNALEKSQSGSSASSNPAADITITYDNIDNSDVADAVETIVKEINANDFGPTICLHRLNNHKTHADVRAICNNVMTAYADDMKASAVEREAMARSYAAEVDLIMKSKKLTDEQKRIQISDLQKKYQEKPGREPILKTLRR